MIDNSALSCRDLAVNLGGTPILCGFHLTARRGRVHALVGRNGAGKSTAYRAMLGLITPDSGSVTVLGKPRTRASLRHIGASINGPALYPHLSAVDNLMIHCHLLGLPRSEAHRALGTVDLPDTRKHTSAFSTGMKARLALAIATLGSPEVLLLDEPHNGLDPQGTVELREFLRQWAARGGAVLMSSHQLDEVAHMADDLTVLSQGRTAYSGTLADFAPPGQLESRFLSLTLAGKGNN
ncbi:MULTISPECIES: ABC transporter ATP-binding protein [unclassified Corynebacterium]|uniref:ABC transporter ATP-binding protein n=1 Tax=unclassified Corynebacterium TaxID=2624378 RepID=UPI0029CA6939|nr:MULTISPECIES: ATP-binding cassette domain-containing protein [unclassified Corynebacterium]WPF66926.1 ATP-binding cassette domain-containing protein [Corynebacterium sp. 22KM0430]WPF69413.1 ATP-binding cassette domain-containing protein [Corynebacterium sp. 21KM1197]